MTDTPLTGLAATWSEFVNHTQMTSFGALVNQLAFFGVVTAATVVGAIAFLDHSAEPYLRYRDPYIRASAQTHESSRAGLGKELLGLVLLTVAGKVVVNAVSNHGNRMTSKERYQSKGDADARVKAEEAKLEEAKAATVTAEHVAVPVPAAIPQTGDRRLAPERERPTMPVGVETDRRKPRVAPPRPSSPFKSPVRPGEEP